MLVQIPKLHISFTTSLRRTGTSRRDTIDVNDKTNKKVSNTNNNNEKNNINTKNENKHGNKHKIRNAVNNKNKKNYNNNDNNNDNNNHNEEHKYVIMKPMELTSRPMWFWSKNGKIKPVTRIKKNTTRGTNGALGEAL